MEEMLIARVLPMMQVRYTRGGQLRYKEHVINFPQDIAVIAQRLPRLPEDVNCVIIRRDGTDLDHHIDFIVRREKVREALDYKIAHDPHYAGLVVDHDALSQLPEQGTVVHRIATCREGQQQPDAAPDAAGPAEAAGENAVEAPDIPDEPEEPTVGGVLNLGVTGPTEVTTVRERANEVLNDAGGVIVSTSIS